MRQSKEIHEHIDAAKQRISSKTNTFVDRFLSLLVVVPVWPRKKQLRRRAQPRLSGGRCGENCIALKSEAGVSRQVVTWFQSVQKQLTKDAKKTPTVDRQLSYKLQEEFEKEKAFCGQSTFSVNSNYRHLQFRQNFHCLAASFWILKQTKHAQWARKEIQRTSCLTPNVTLKTWQNSSNELRSYRRCGQLRSCDLALKNSGGAQCFRWGDTKA